MKRKLAFISAFCLSLSAFAQAWITIDAVAPSYPPNHAIYWYEAPATGCPYLEWGRTYQVNIPFTVTINTNEGPVATPVDRWWALNIQSNWLGTPRIQPCFTGDGWLDRLVFEPWYYDPAWNSGTGGWRKSNEWKIALTDPIYDNDEHWPIENDPPYSSPPVGTWTFNLSTDVIEAWGNMAGFPAGTLGTSTTATVTIDGDNVSVFIGTLLRSDLNQNRAVEVSDIFMFLEHWFQNDEIGDWNNSTTCEVDDIFAFLGEWFSNR